MDLHPTYYLKEGYSQCQEYLQYDDTKWTDEFQDHVYKLALEEFNEECKKRENILFLSVTDLGCGSGFKLMKYFGDCNTLGIDLEPNISHAREAYRHLNEIPLSCNWHQWLRFTVQPFSAIQLLHRIWNHNFLICSDTLEHAQNPDLLMDLMVASNAERIVLSTPIRDEDEISLFRNGPPRNIYHLREWTFEEFAQYVGQFLQVEKHLIVEEVHQVMVCRQKE